MEQSGAVLREVGTTNRTRIADYENAVTEKTRLLLRVHPSNFTVTGFTDKPEIAELIANFRRHPLCRALRVDKLTITAMEATLRAYLRAAWDEIPAQRMIRSSV